MPLDPNIIMGVKPLQVENPVNQLGQILQLQGAQQANQLNTMKMGEYQQQQERRNKLLQLMGGLPAGATDEQRSAALKGGGYFDEADKLDKGVLERMKTKSEAAAKDIETAHKRVDLAGSAFNYVRQNPTLENAMAVIDHLQTNGIYSKEQADQYKAQVSQNPAAIQQLADVAYRGALSAKEQLPAFDNFSAGDRHVTQQRDPVTGAIKEVGSVTIKESESQRLAREQQAKEAAAGRAVTMRGQDLTNSRSIEANRIAAENKQDKPLTDSQSKAALFGTRMQQANKILETLAENGTTKSVPGIDAGYGIGSVVNTIASKDQQQLAQAKRDFLNAVLRRESGAVIGASEFASGDKQYFPQIGDSKEVIAQKKANREIAMRGILAEVPEGKRAEIVGQISGDSKPEGTWGSATGGKSGGFKYLGTEK